MSCSAIRTNVTVMQVIMDTCHVVRFEANINVMQEAIRDKCRVEQ